MVIHCFPGNVVWVWKWQLQLLFLYVCVANGVYGQVRYSIPEEMTKGSFVGNIAQDLGLDAKRLKSGRARVFTEDGREYIGLNTDKGTLLVKERIDREELCGPVSPCSLHFQIILEDPLELHRVDIEILDINDNSPVFARKEINFEISEFALSGALFSLDGAKDPDVGVNTLQTYKISPNDHFTVKVLSRLDGTKYVEMVLQNPLDREKQAEHKLVLTAYDGGTPQKSGTVTINIIVLDANDNAPVFLEPVYKASLRENSVMGTTVLKVSATDSDTGSNGEVTYSFSDGADTLSVLDVNPHTGAITVSGLLDFEKFKQYEINVQATDKGGLTSTSKVIIDIIDVNDNVPVITLMSFSNLVPEDCALGTVIAILKIKDIDSGKNGKVKCFINLDLPFKITNPSSDFYSLVTDQVLDREKVSEYTITITAVDEGSPSYSSNKTLTLQLSDVNDHAPVFERKTYTVNVQENNAVGASIFTIKASDADTGNNAYLSYFLVDTEIHGILTSSYISVNAENGALHAMRSFDYEQIKELQIHIKAQDGGSPPLSSNATITIVITDQNDNAPQVLYPAQTGGSLVAEMVPRSAEVGYLVTKVVAVDVDSGQNAWLSYKLLKAADRPLFEVGLQNGEIRTIRQVSDKDAVKQKVTVIVEDNGQPPRSATVSVNVAVADSFPEILSEFTDFTHDKDYNDNMTFYLILALAVISFLFVSSVVVIISVKIYKWRQSRLFYESSLPVIPYYPPLYADVDGTGTLQHVYNYEVCRTTDSRKSDTKYIRPCTQSIVSMDVSGTETMPRSQQEVESHEFSENQQKPPNTDWRFSQNQRPGPSGCSKLESAELRWTSNKRTRAGVPPEGAVGTGPWPNPPTEAEQLQALMAAANEVSEATATLGPGTMGLSTRYSPQFTLQHVPDYRQNVYIPGSTATLTANPQQQALPPPQAQAPPPTQAEPPKAAQTPASKKKSAKKEKK
ncbi:protocadherin gamma-A11-like isoform X13 [Brienomyrus brachyistius]|uniref:protocadherin gamma-A11-like isoform X13 n=1 Tax=Brienomyrus brachyistius TaxID=42636 RepID=UPI0020B3EAAE|nr:protocadherin gamma-A11-like isoform X13 [Brienomyrus brachyistius]